MYIAPLVDLWYFHRLVFWRWRLWSGNHISIYLLISSNQIQSNPIYSNLSISAYHIPKWYLFMSLGLLGGACLGVLFHLEDCFITTLITIIIPLIITQYYPIWFQYYPNIIHYSPILSNIIQYYSNIIPILSHLVSGRLAAQCYRQGPGPTCPADRRRNRPARSAWNTSGGGERRPW